ncbi:hypothetical protein WJX74_001010 [Apatococcus lobatus]|uniref:DUF676 domain-containing protein n=1 Tax=Apatococcus lobatus TaxID=904363 RepID=A0AAW1RY59_9CHLO
MSVSTNAAPGQGQGAFAAQQPPMVVFFHGLRKKREQMLPMSRSVGQATGWEVYSLAYPSTEQPLHLLAKGMAEEVRALAQPTQPVYAVTYSMGGVLLRHMMNLPQKGGINWQGCVMIAPPNQGSRTARIMSRVFLVRKIFSLLPGICGGLQHSTVLSTFDWNTCNPSLTGSMARCPTPMRHHCWHEILQLEELDLLANYFVPHSAWSSRWHVAGRGDKAGGRGGLYNH